MCGREGVVILKKTCIAMLLKRSGGVEWLLVFLGNPGLRYHGTRHNAGYMVGDALSRKLGVRIDRLRFRALTARCTIEGHEVLLMKPQTYMNLSGEAVGAAAKFYKIPPERVLVVSDEVHLPTGRVRVRKKGSAGGQNGLKSIISHLGTDAFPRVRVGVGEPPHPDYDMADWVLGTFKNEDAARMEQAAEHAAEACLCYLTQGADAAMTRYNQK